MLHQNFENNLCSRNINNECKVKTACCLYEHNASISYNDKPKTEGIELTNDVQI